MWKARDIWNRLSYFIIAILFTFSINICVVTSTLLEVGLVTLLVVTIISVGIMFVVFYNRILFYTTVAIVVIVTLFLVFGFRNFSTLRQDQVLYELYNFVFNAIMFVSGYLPYQAVYCLPIITMVSLLLAAFCSAAFLSKREFELISLLGVFYFVINWLTIYPKSDLAFIIFLLVFLALLAGRLNKGLQTKAVLTMMPLCIAALTASFFLPSATKEAIYPRRPMNPINLLDNFLYEAFNPKYFFFMSTGFGGNGSLLGGPVALNNRYVMEVESDERTYLAGTIKSRYTGSAWEGNSQEFYMTIEDGRNMEFYEADPFLLLIKDIEQFQPIYIDDNKIMSLENISINIGSYRSGTLFRPAKYYSLDFYEPDQVVTNKLGDLRVNFLMPQDTEYSYKYMLIDYNQPIVIDQLRSSDRGYYDYVVMLNEQRGSNKAFSNYAKIIEELYLPYSKEVYSEFTQLPEALPGRVKELALEITDGLDNDYDKVKALEEYLAAFPYTLTPKPTPRNTDFVDYFLFEGKEGYCTYYASALAVMTRCLGIPSRYLEGYAMPSNRNENGNFTITNAQAHAWVEVYFEGFGWVPFEPTAPYNYSFYHRSVPNDTNIFSSDFAASSAYMDYMNELMYGVDNYKPSGYIPPTILPSDEKTFPLLPIAVGVVFVPAVLAVVMLIRLVSLKRFYSRIGKMEANDKVISYFRAILKLTAYFRYPMEDGETPSDYANRLGRRFTFDNESKSLHDLVKLYNRARFGPPDITTEETKVMEDAYFELLNYIKKLKQRASFAFNRYVLKRFS